MPMLTTKSGSKAMVVQKSDTHTGPDVAVQLMLKRRGGTDHGVNGALVQCAPVLSAPRVRSRPQLSDTNFLATKHKTAKHQACSPHTTRGPTPLLSLPV